MPEQNKLCLQASDEAAMVALGHQVAKVLKRVIKSSSFVIFLKGDLGAGKTTLSRGILSGLGHLGAVKSPTYTLVEPYELDFPCYHFDLYRLGDPEELEYMGIRDYFSGASLSLIEWPSKGLGVLPEADMLIDIAVDGTGRRIVFNANSDYGQALLEYLPN